MSIDHRAAARRIGVAIAAAGLSAGLLGATVQPAEAAGAGTATVKEFKKIKNGQKLAKVRKVVGGKGARVTGITEAPIYVWRSTGGKNAYVLFDQGRVADKVRLDDQTVSVAEYRKLKNGGSYTKARKTIRESGYLLFDEREGGKRYQDYLWVDDTFTQFVWVEFVNGKQTWKVRFPVDELNADSRVSGRDGRVARVPPSVLAQARAQLVTLAR